MRSLPLLVLAACGAPAVVRPAARPLAQPVAQPVAATAASQPIQLAACAPASWTRSDVGHVQNVGTALAIGRDDEPRIAYVTPGGRLAYAEHTANGWRSYDVAEAGGPGWYPSLALDKEGQAHIVFDDGSAVRYAHGSARTWSVETIGTSYAPRSFASVAIDHHGTVHVAYSSEHTVRYATRTAGGWDESTIGPGEGSGTLVFDAGDVPHVIYDEYDDNDKFLPKGLFHAVPAADGTWLVTPLARAGVVPSAAIDTGGTVRVMFQTNTGSGAEISYASLAHGTWSSRLIDAGPLMSYSAQALALDREDADLLYLVLDGGLRRVHMSWAGTCAEDVDAGARTGFYVGAAHDRRHRLHVIYVDLASDPILRYAVAAP